MSSGQRVNVLEAFPLLTEFLADIGIGYLIIFTMYPFLQFLIFDVVPEDYSALINIFSSSWVSFKELNYVSIFIAFIIGIASRHPTWLIMSLFRKYKCIECCFAHLAYKTLQRQFGKEIFEFYKVKENFIDKNPFWRAGDEEYADFRANLVCEEGELQNFKRHWAHEEFLWFQYYRLYCFGLTFLLVYLLYGVLVIYYLSCIGEPFEITYIMSWITILAISSFITFSFYRGHIYHGMAFVAIDELLLKKFKAEKKDRYFQFFF